MIGVGIGLTSVPTLARALELSGDGPLQLTLADIGAPATAVGTYLLRATLVWDTGAPVNAGVLEVSDGTSNNRAATQHVQASGLRLLRVDAGAQAVSAASSSAPSNGVSFGMAHVVLANRQSRLLVNAAPAVFLNLGPAGGLTTLSILSMLGGTPSSAGTWRFRYLPEPLSDAAATAAIAAFV